MFEFTKDVILTFGVSAGLSFVVSIIVLLVVVHTKGLLKTESYQEVLLPAKVDLGVKSEVTPLTDSTECRAEKKIHL